MRYPGHLEEVLVRAEVHAGNDSLGQRHNDLAAQASGRADFSVVPLESGSPIAHPYAKVQKSIYYLTGESLAAKGEPCH
jgi:hypothetical protein